MALKLTTSNRLEILAQRLSEALKAPLPDPFQSEVVVVQSRGMARWLSQQLAQEHCICANYAFPFPKSFAHRLFQALVPDLPETSPYDPALLQWRLMRLLPHFSETSAFEPVQRYLLGDDKNLRIYQLAQKVAHVFDQYLVYRPELIARWDSGQDDHWQAILWHELTREINSPHPAQLQARALEILVRKKPKLKSLPPRISFFAISALPDFYVRLFTALSEHREINFLLLQPTKEEWSGIMSKRESARAAKKAGGHFTEEQLHFEQGHPLLASWGAVGRAFFKSLLDHVPLADGPDDPFALNESPLLLHQLQDDIVHLNDRSKSERAVIQRGDDSIQVHSCHTPIRELEVLQDHMLKWFQDNPSLKPRDVVVMMPEVEKYAPFIQAVFDVPEEWNRRIPFSIADRSIKDESQVAETLLKILDLADSRCGARSVLAILENRTVQQKFHLTESEMELFVGWLKKAGIRWGVDEHHRASLDLPAIAENSWEYGLRRLLLGYAMAGHGEKMFGDIQPVDEIEGSFAATLGKLVEFTECLFGFRAQLNAPRSLERWSELLLYGVNTFFHSDRSTQHEMPVIRLAIAALAEQQKLAELEDPVSVSVIRTHLQQVLKDESLGGGFLTGRVTFCGLKPLRSLPFKVVCLLGMNDTDVPRQNAHIGFDLMHRSPRPGDPSPRNDDQYLFLEALLSAREKFYISYIGQSVKDNKTIPPSVFVSELLDCLKTSFAFAEGALTENDIVTRQRLQAFSRDYFNGRFFSFSKANAAALLASQTRNTKLPPVFVSRPLPEPDSEFRTVSLRSLTEFFKNPAKFFLQKRLKLKLSETPESLEECEPFEVDGLDGYSLKQSLLEKKLDGVDLDTCFPLAQSGGQMPYGPLAKASFGNISREVEHFTGQLQSILGGHEWQSVGLDKTLGPFSFSADFRVTATGLLQFRCAKIKAADVLRAWVAHVALNVAQPEGARLETLLLGMPDKTGEAELAVWKFLPLTNAEEHLTKLLEAYWNGLSQPLKFFPESSLACAEALLDGKDNPLSYAEKKWVGGDYARAEADDMWFQFCFRNVDPLDETFCQLSKDILLPALQHREA